MCKQPLLHNFFDSLSRRVFISHVQAVNLETFFATIRISGCAAATIWDNSSSFSWRDLLEIKDQCFISTYAVNIQIHRNDWDHQRHIEIWFPKNPDELAQQQKQQQSQLILRSPPESKSIHLKSSLLWQPSSSSR